MKIWNYETGDLLANYRPSVFTIQRIVFSPSGNQLICIGSSRNMPVWDLIELLAEIE